LAARFVTSSQGSGPNRERAGFCDIIARTRLCGSDAGGVEEQSGLLPSETFGFSLGFDEPKPLRDVQVINPAISLSCQPRPI